MTVTPARPPCELPALPGPLVLDAQPVAGDPDGLLVTRAKLAELAEYIVRLQGWQHAAAICLEVKP